MKKNSLTWLATFSLATSIFLSSCGSNKEDQANGTTPNNPTVNNNGIDDGTSNTTDMEVPATTDMTDTMTTTTTGTTSSTTGMTTGTTATTTGMTTGTTATTTGSTGTTAGGTTGGTTGL